MSSVCIRLLRDVTIVKFYFVLIQGVESMTENSVLTGRPLQLLRRLYNWSDPITNYTLKIKQNELASQLGISRQALNVHLRKLRDRGYIRTGRGFIDVTEEGLTTIGISVNPAFVFVKISPLKRKRAYEEIFKFPILRVYRVAGEMDMILVIEHDKVDDALKRLANVEGVLETRTYITIQTLK